MQVDYSTAQRKRVQKSYVLLYYRKGIIVYTFTVKKVSDFPVPSRDVIILFYSVEYQNVRVPSSELGPPTPSPASECVSPPWT